MSEQSHKQRWAIIPADETLLEQGYHENTLAYYPVAFMQDGQNLSVWVL